MNYLLLFSIFRSAIKIRFGCDRSKGENICMHSVGQTREHVSKIDVNGNPPLGVSGVLLQQTHKELMTSARWLLLALHRITDVRFKLSRFPCLLRPPYLNITDDVLIAGGVKTTPSLPIRNEILLAVFLACQHLSHEF